MRKNKSAKLLLWIGIAGMSMFFAGLTSAYIVRKAEGNWSELPLPDWFLYSTIIISFSSFCLIKSLRNIKRNKNISNWLLCSLILGSFFAYFQIKGWQDLVEQGFYMTGEGSNISASFLYVITLSHLAHLSGGLIALLVITVNSKYGKYNSDSYLGIELISIYWHYLGCLWLYLYLFMLYI